MARHSLGSISPQRSTAAAISSTVSAIQPVWPGMTISGTRAARGRDHGDAAGHGLRHHQPERLVPRERIDQGERTVQKAHALVEIDLADIRDPAAEAWLHVLGEVAPLLGRRSLPASTSGMPAARATSIAVTGPLSADMRPSRRDTRLRGGRGTGGRRARSRWGSWLPTAGREPWRGGSRSATRARRRG